jgi:hypothetical protein
LPDGVVELALPVLAAGGHDRREAKKGTRTTRRGQRRLDRRDPGNVIDYAFIRAESANSPKVQDSEIGIDPYNAVQIAPS